MSNASRIFKGVVSGERQHSNSDVASRASRIAAGLDHLGVREGDSVAILMRNDIAFIEVVHGVMQLGAYGVPVNWHFKPAEIGFILEDSRAAVLVGHADLLHPLEAVIPKSVVALSVATPPEVIIAYKIDRSRAAKPTFAIDFESWIVAQELYQGPAASQPMTMIYTSGTTGHPKGVRRAAPTAEENAALEHMRAMIYGSGKRALLPGPLYHSAPNFFSLHSSRRGGTLVLMPRFEPEEFLRLVEAHNVDTTFMVPTMFNRLLQLPRTVRTKYDLSSLRHVVHAAAPCPPEVKRAMIDWWGPIICEFYGSTESGVVTFATAEDALKKPGTVGRLSPGTEVRFVDAEGQVLPAGKIGEIYSRNPAYPQFTYHNRPNKRAEIEQGGFISSGDIGYMDADGYVFICDRKRDMVISGGVNIYPAEIEAVLHGLPGVHDCAVFGIPDSDLGEVLIALVEPQTGVTLDLAHVRAGLKTCLANYKVPRHIEIRTGLPREDSGKIFKRRLRDLYWKEAGRRI
ncbi:long-chain fatty acid--CoA ligase [Bradyrhizobium canariense]|uniref:acyl-CoA synthetase n=1 Tax=Bradyrhizobium canariense TaxID=255045 RepID=UPI000A190881|nr:acyl-CoA synthetase [Bradyrhizobium canariense]OSI75606.1 long-chain fatty acid--CoA ligase [Bradyrhizobium canariense]